MSSSKDKVLMHSSTVAVFLVFFLGCVAYLFSNYSRYTPQDQADYAHIVEGKEEDSAQDNYVSRQSRIGLQKDLYADGHQLHLASDDAELVLEKSEGKVEIIEQMNQVTFSTKELEKTGSVSDQQEFTATADHAVYTREKIPEPVGILVLTGHVEVKGNEIGTIKAAHEVRVIHDLSAGQKTLRAIETDRDTILNFIYEKDGFSHTLSCYGPMRIDHRTMKTTFESPVSPNGAITEDKQVLFQDAKGEIRANQAIVEYGYVEKKLAPQKIILIGNVKISQQLSSGEDGAKPALQYILADRVDFVPLTKEMTFTATPGNRVLFFDKSNDFEVSAQSMKIVRDKATKKETIQGAGDVRFSLADHEFDQLRRRFSLEKKTQK